MARKYEIPVFTGCGHAVSSCTCEHMRGEARTGVMVTAIDLRDVEPLVEALKEAVDMVEHWSSYASVHFQEKWDLDGDLRQLRGALKAFEEQPAGVGAGVGKPQGPGAGEVAPPRSHAPSADSDGNQHPQGGDAVDARRKGETPPPGRVVAEGDSVQCDGVGLAQLREMTEVAARAAFVPPIREDRIADMETALKAVLPLLTQQSSGGQEGGVEEGADRCE